MGQWLKLSELTLRWVSGAVLIPFGLFVVWSGGFVLLLTCSVFAGIMSFEWARMSGAKAPYFLGLGGALCLLSLHIGPPYSPLVGVIILNVINLLVQNGRRTRLECFNGVAYALALAWSLYMLRSGSWNGLTAALVLMPIVWVSDISAFFIGKHFGGPNLSAKYSPKKTWSGAIGALITCGIFGLIAAYFLEANPVFWLIVGVLSSVVAQYGDFFESVQKRRLHAKDASGLIPGHGGFMDRVDGLGAMSFFWVIVFVLLPSIPPMLGLV